MENNIYPCLWFNQQAHEAAAFYCDVFNGKLSTSNAMVATVDIYGKKFMCLNGGHMHKINPSISFFVYCNSAQEVDQFWQKLLDDGHVLLPLNTYDWSERYGWIADKFGVSWQVMYSEKQAAIARIVPAFLFSSDKFGKAYEAIQYYHSIFPNSSINSTQFYPAEAEAVGNRLALAHFSLNGTLLSALDGALQHQFAFNEGVSMVVPCTSQNEIDHYWGKLTEGGHESMCGWLKDKYGVSWQVIPDHIGQLMSNTSTGAQVAQALMHMKKIDIETLHNAAIES